jgi:hypothetical protein
LKNHRISWLGQFGVTSWVRNFDRLSVGALPRRRAADDRLHGGTIGEPNGYLANCRKRRKARRGQHIMTERESHVGYVPEIDWQALVFWTLLVTTASMTALMFVR